MGVHVVIQPVTGYGAAVVSPSPGVRQLIAGGNSTTLIIQVPARIGGLADTARFARSLAAAAGEFSEWCETQNRNRTYTSPLAEQWSGFSLNFPERGDELGGSSADGPQS